jgi:hypothetical protein
MESTARTDTRLSAVASGRQWRFFGYGNQTSKTVRPTPSYSSVFRHRIIAKLEVTIAASSLTAIRIVTSIIASVTAKSSTTAAAALLQNLYRSNSRQFFFLVTASS